MAQSEPVLVLPPNATNDEFNAGRAKQATRRGDDVYLPFFGKGFIAFPSCFIRSSLFPAGAVSKEIQFAPRMIETWRGHVSIYITGPGFTSLERRTFSACLEHYRNRPLAAGEGGQWVSTTLGQIASSAGVSSDAGLRDKIAGSLIRLAQTEVVIRQDGTDFRLKSLIEVDGIDAPAIEGERRKVRLRIQQELADLYGKDQWRKIPMAALTFSKLRGWLACFFASHSEPAWLSIAALHRLSGLNCRISDFKGRLLHTALKDLQSNDTPPSVRIASFDTDGKPSDGDEKQGLAAGKLTGNKIKVTTCQMLEKKVTSSPCDERLNEEPEQSFD